MSNTLAKTPPLVQVLKEFCLSNYISSILCPMDLRSRVIWPERRGQGWSLGNHHQRGSRHSLVPQSQVLRDQRTMLHLRVPKPHVSFWNSFVGSYDSFPHFYYSKQIRWKVPSWEWQQMTRSNKQVNLITWQMAGIVPRASSSKAMPRFLRGSLNSWQESSNSRWDFWDSKTPFRDSLWYN